MCVGVRDCVRRCVWESECMYVVCVCMYMYVCICIYVCIYMYEST